MFDLVNDIPSYPQFMDGCVGAEVLQHGEGFVEARLDLSRGGLQQSFVTRNQLQAPQRVSMQLVEGPFKRFQGDWTFTPLRDNACKVSLDLEFEFRNKLVALAANRWFEQVANQMVDALCRRADVVYRD
ncbi:type II toxin-antitoxin system RatA family toxin [Exilibacterium tricleocarpae]|uniref:Type II toxin-antitoxin system RatA family toxin n=2 Tax=Exilibacterium tricleocarpae TaxID=2591008 RepID=A0A545TBH4_9GAMM|nr:type II toxin-antitoxin system RatA family toxin [Exilibacterium tricleocarpae]